MNEEEKTNEEVKEEPKKEPTTLERAHAAADRLEAANTKTEELVTRQEALVAEQMLSGKSEAGMEALPKKEETPAEYKDKVMRGEV